MAGLVSCLHVQTVHWASSMLSVAKAQNTTEGLIFRPFRQNSSKKILKAKRGSKQTFSRVFFRLNVIKKERKKNIFIQRLTNVIILSRNSNHARGWVKVEVES